MDEQRRSGQVPASAQVLKVVKIVRDRKTLQNVLRTEPPFTLPYTAFLATPANLGYSKIVCRAIYCVGRLCEYSMVLDKPALCPFDVDFFITIFAWIEYLLPIRDDVDLSPLDAETRIFLTLHFTPGAFTFLEAFASHSTPERVYDVVLDSRQRVTSIVVNTWMHWTKTFDCARAVEDGVVGQTSQSVIFMPLYNAALIRNNIAHAIFIAEILRAVDGHPRRFFRRYAQYIHSFKAFPVFGEDPDFMPRFLVGAGQLALTKELAFGYLPDEVLEAMIASLDHYIEKKCAAVWRGAWEALSTLCLHRVHALPQSVAHGLLLSLARMRREDPRVHSLKAIMDMIPGTIESTRTARGFHETYSHFMRTHASFAFNANEKVVIELFEKRFELLQTTDEAWELVNTCCNASCPMGDTGSGHLRSCLCGEALYCSRACQRRHWHDGGHRNDCPGSSFDKYGTITSRELNRVLTEARSNIELHYPHILAERASDPNAPIHLTMDIREDKENHVLKIEPGIPDGVANTTVVVDFLFRQYGGEHARRFYFVPEGWAGRVRMPYRLLTETFFRE
ncbi:hypothetical protein BD626DRAFT_574152 [Schizophyllum amplum]|uniref:MYND-type domain-containing protein n=1 Tax=Schizophyllum amplum TaxID=97359 RepID=A0A550BZ42_9AGAR|nr:hypothetical protein BD626DRAFT_574152 [Auriculariopsis ampla]